jgi:hypothetical protein
MASDSPGGLGSQRFTNTRRVIIYKALTPKPEPTRDAPAVASLPPGFDLCLAGEIWRDARVLETRDLESWGFESLARHQFYRGSVEKLDISTAF